MADLFPAPPPDSRDTGALSSPDTLRSSGPTPAFRSGLSAIDALRRRHGLGSELLDQSLWVGSKMLAAVVSALRGVGQTVINPYFFVPVTAAATFFLNPILYRQLQDGGGWMVDGLEKMSGSLAQKPVGQWLLDTIQSVCHNPLLVESNPQINQGRAPLVNFALLIGGLSQMVILSYPVVKVFEHVLSRVNRRELARQGKEPLPLESTPALALVGPSDFIETLLVNSVPRHRRDLKHPVVLVHTDPGIPALYTEGRADFHLDVSGSPLSIVSEGSMKSNGLDRAENVVLVGFNPNRAAFYGNDANGPISPSMCSTFLSMLASKRNALTKRVVAIVPRDADLLAGTTRFADLLKPHTRLMTSLEVRGIRVEVIHPENVLLALVGKEIAGARLERGDAAEKRLKICLIGDKDEQALRTFARSIEASYADVTVTILADRIMGDLQGDEFDKLSLAQRMELKCRHLSESALNFVYGTDDHATTDLGAVSVFDASSSPHGDPQERRQTICIVETPQGCVDAATLGLRSLSIYQGLREEVEAALARVR